MSDENVAVVVPVRNGERTLERCLASIRAQEQRTELVVVDNGSSDNSPAIAKEYADIFLEAPARRGIHRNIGFAASTAPFLLYVDADMTLEGGLLHACIQLCTQGFGAVVIPEESTGLNFWGRARAFERNMYLGDPTVESPRFLTRSWYQAIGGFREHLTGFEDMALANELTKAGCPIGRSNLRIFHDEGSPSLRGVFGKKRFWGRYLPAYVRDYPHAFKSQATVRRSWFRHPSLLLRSPSLTAGMLVLKATDAAGLLSGFAETWVNERRIAK